MSLPPPDIVRSPSRLAALAHYGILDTPAEPVFDDIVTLARLICDTPVALVSFVASERQWFKARVGLEACETPIEQSVCAHAIAQGRMLIIPDLTRDPRTKDNTLVTAAPFIRFYAGALLTAPDGELLGTLCVIDYKPRPQGLTLTQTEALDVLGRQVVNLLDMRIAVGSREDELSRERQSSRLHLDRALMSEATGELLRRESTRTRAAQEAGRIGTFELDIDSNMMRVSGEFCRIFGLPIQAIYPARTLEALVIPEDKPLASSDDTRARRATTSSAEYRIRRADDGSVRWVARRGEFANADNRSATFSGTVHDVTERKLADLRQAALVALGDEIRDAETTADTIAVASRILGQTLSASRSTYASIDLQSNTFHLERDWTASGIRSVVGHYSLAQIPATIGRLKRGEAVVVNDIATADWLGDERARYEASGTKARIQVPLLRDGKLVGVLAVHSTEPRAWTPAEVEFVQAVADRTYAAVARIEAEEHQGLLNQELSHRLKNTLAMVQAIAGQTLRAVPDRNVVRAFTDRLIALGKAHDALLWQNWVEARIATVVEGVLSLHMTGERLQISGPDINVGARGVMSLTMLLHEIATNALKYGAWSGPAGTVALTWRIENTAPESTFVMTWTEHGGPPVSEPTQRGFGSRLISAGLVGTGGASLHYYPSGFTAEFRAPLPLMTGN